jgi:hypothetical protein
MLQIYFTGILAETAACLHVPEAAGAPQTSAYIPIVLTETATRASNPMSFSYVPGILATVG